MVVQSILRSWIGEEGGQRGQASRGVTDGRGYKATYQTVLWSIRNEGQEMLDSLAQPLTGGHPGFLAGLWQRRPSWLVLGSSGIEPFDLQREALEDRLSIVGRARADFLGKDAVDVAFVLVVQRVERLGQVGPLRGRQADDQNGALRLPYEVGERGDKLVPPISHG